MPRCFSGVLAQLAEQRIATPGVEGLTPSWGAKLIGSVAQLAVRRTHNPKGVGSIPARTTKLFLPYKH